jgi:lipoprotein-releasing system permease protein
LYLTFAWRYFRAKKNANAVNIIAWVTVGVIAFATACQILVLSVFNGFEGLVKSLYADFYADVRISPAKGKTLTLNAGRFRELAKIPGVSAVCTVAEEKALLQNGESQTVVFLKGVDSAYGQVCNLPEKIYQGSYQTGTAEQPQLVVGAGIQNAAGISTGNRTEPSRVTLILPRKGAVSAADPLQSLAEGEALVSGAFSIQQDFDSRYAITNIGFIKSQMGYAADEFSALELRLRNDRPEEETLSLLKNNLGAGFRVLDRYGQNSSLYRTMRMEKWVIYAVLTLILLVAAFNMISALTMLVLEKKKDISVLQSLGAGRSAIARIFLSEGMLLGIIGCGAGMLMALVVAFLQVRYKLVKLEGGSFLIDYFPVRLKPEDFFLVAATALFIVFLSAYFPARKASRQVFNLKA